MNEVRARAALRLVRGFLVGLIASGIGILAHTSADGLLPSWPWLVVVAVVLSVASSAWLARPAGWLRLTVLVGGGQLAMHLVLSILAGHEGARPAADAVVPPAPDLTAVDRRGSLFELTTTPDPVAAGGAAPGGHHWMSHMVGHLTGAETFMTLAHLGAAAVVAWWLAQGERALWTLLVLVAARLVRRVRTLLTAGALRPLIRRPMPAVALAAPRRLLPLVDLPARRGPPAYVI